MVFMLYIYFSPFCLFLWLKLVGERVLANGSSWGLFFIVRPSFLSGMCVYFRSEWLTRASSAPQTQSPERNPCLGASRAPTGAARWRDGAVIPEREGRSAAGVPLSQPVSAPSAQPWSGGKADEPRHLLAAPGVAETLSSRLRAGTRVQF